MDNMLELAKSLLKHAQENPEEMEVLSKKEPAKEIKEPAKEAEVEKKSLTKSEFIKKEITETNYTPVFQKSLEKDVVDFKSGKRLDQGAIKRRARIQSSNPKGHTSGYSGYGPGLGGAQDKAIQQSDRRSQAQKQRRQVNKEEMSKMGFAKPQGQMQPRPKQKPQGIPKMTKPPQGGQGGAPAAPPMMKDSDHVTQEKRKWKKESYNKPKRSLPKRDRRKEDRRYTKEELSMAKKDAIGEYKPKFQKGCSIPANKVIKPKG